MGIGTSLMTDGKAAMPGEPNQGAFDPSTVSVETLAGVDDARSDAAGAALPAVASGC
jgi:hypothetical protein